MKQILIGLILVLSLNVLAQAENEMKIEGSCSGRLVDGTKVSFRYFSNFNGCQDNINAAIRFAPDFETNYSNGKRAFVNHQDVYTLDSYRVTFKDATGNIGGLFSYVDADSKRQTINVQCAIRDYEYEECPI